MSKHILKGLVVIAGLWAFSGQVLADCAKSGSDWQADCACLATLATPIPGACDQINGTKANIDQYQPPQACVDKDSLDSFPLGSPAACQSGGGTSSGTGAGSGGTGGEYIQSTTPPSSGGTLQ